MLAEVIKTYNVVIVYLSSSDTPAAGTKKIKNLEVARFTFVSTFSPNAKKRLSVAA